MCHPWPMPEMLQKLPALWDPRGSGWLNGEMHKCILTGTEKRGWGWGWVGMGYRTIGIFMTHQTTLVCRRTQACHFSFCFLGLSATVTGS